MEFVKLQRHDIIKLKKGMFVWTEVPTKFVTSNNLFAPKTKTLPASFEIGKIYEFPNKTTTSLVTIKNELRDKINSKLSSYGANPEDYKEKIDNFIESLDLSIEEDTFDTSIYEGEYRVYHTSYEGGSNWIYCEKLDDSGLELKFEYVKSPDKIKFKLLNRPS